MNFLLKKQNKWLTFAACLLPLGYSSIASANSVNGQYTHDVNVPSSITVGQSINMTWSPKSAFSGIYFNFVKTGVKAPSAGSYTYLDLSGASGARNIVANETGQWCFRARGYAPHNGGFGWFEERCTQVNPINVNGNYTHNISLPSSVTAGQNINMSWSPKSQYSSVNFSFVKTGVKAPSASSYTYTDLNGASGSRNVAASKPGLWCFRARGYAPQNGGFGWFEESCVNVAAAPPAPVSGSANLDVPGATLTDNWFSDRDTLKWNVAGVNNATHYNIVVNRSTGVQYINQIASNNAISFHTGMLTGSFATNNNISVQLQACNSVNACTMVSSASPLVLVKTNGVPVYNGQPKHINQFSSEMVYSDRRKKWIDDPDCEVEPCDQVLYPTSLYAAKRWKFANWENGWTQTSYDIDLVDVFKTYLYQYDLPASPYDPANLPGPVPLKKDRPLFDAFSFVNQEFKIVDGGGAFARCNQMRDTFVEGSPNQLSGNIKECVNDYFDLLFGIKMKQHTGSYNWFAKKNQSLLDALHDASKDVQREVGFYMVIPSGIVDEATTSKRRQMFINEALEQYALWRAKHNNNTWVRLAGFYQQQESTPKPTDVTKANSQKNIHQTVKDRIKSFNAALTYNSSSYNTMGAYIDPVRYPTFCSAPGTTLEDCLVKSTAMRHLDAVALFDNLEFQPNVGIFRFNNRSPSYVYTVDDKNTTTTADDITISKLSRDDTLPSDMEMLHWYNEILFKPMSKNGIFAGEITTNFGIHFEYNRLYENRTGLKSSYKIEALNGEGFYGDISRYADFMMNEYPEDYLTGPSPIIYDDAGGILYCHIKYAVGEDSGNKECRDNSKEKGYGKLRSSISDVRSMYAWNNATRQNSATARKAVYKANTQFDPHNPIQEAKPSVSVEFAVNGQSLLDFQALVKARLTDEHLHANTAGSVCSKSAGIKLEYMNNSTLLKTEEVAHPLADLQCANFLQSKTNLFNKSVPVFQEMIYKEWKKKEYPNLPAKSSDIVLDIGKMKFGSLDEEQWKLFRTTVNIPAGTNKIRLTLMANPVQGLSAADSNRVESILYYRPDYLLR